ncbi:MAG: zinc-binding dehydrogenase [Rhodospirillales bacterium]|jgi:alcohol dehydrogenase|nr:zinc-binding dehydrogenase [Rhodospirillales bacterium]MDP6643870.1 zinc-binding dehydrogenase [Rhodospirillales bacterium]MDP6842203.1 zinc-binding dehydrogenase [Rhodospirillales bacterium]
MKAVVLYEHGQMDKLIYEENYPDPECGAKDAIVRVKATSLNYHDLFTRNGMPGLTLELPRICGLDVAGEIVETGSEIKGWSVGDAVLIDPRNRVEGGLVGETIDGGLAEYCRSPDHQLIKIPDGVSYAQAASLPVAYGTAHRMMVTRGQVTADDKVLILGASGGVGTGAVLLAKIMGAEVVALSSSEAKMQALTDMGADHVINYLETDWVKETWKLYTKPHRRKYEGGVTVVVNFTGGDTWVQGMRCLRRGGRMLTCGATDSFDPKTDLRYVWSFEFDIRGSNSWEPEDLTALLGMIRDGRMEVPIAGTYPLTEATEALRLIEDREVIGKVIVAP